MGITKYYHHQGHIDELIDQHPALIKFKKSALNRSSNCQWTDTESNQVGHHIMVSFFGKSGYGKSSTVNALFGRSILETSDVMACTKRCDSLDFKISGNYFLSFADYPGIGESEYQDREYLEMYKSFLEYSQIVVYVLRADMRDYSIDEQAFRTVFYKTKKQVIFALNCCDKIEPVNRKNTNTPSHEQLSNINNKIRALEKIFKPNNPIIPYSAVTGWNLKALSEGIVDVASKCDSISFNS